ncbi:hypothetical protein V6N12_024859 [Hibiscus sabdariffa]|uniref:NB-ARC domain-containing protein n=1 Tax=Hibiscus sabdariffa TaxID=183260 RepID=A0ABR2BBF3_9ROSI
MDPSSEIIVETEDVRLPEPKGKCATTLIKEWLWKVEEIKGEVQPVLGKVDRISVRGCKPCLKIVPCYRLCRRMAKKHLKVEEIKGEVQPVLGKVDRISVRGCKPCLKIVPCYRLCRLSRNSKDPLLLVREKLNLINELESSSGSRAEWGKTTLACNLNKELESSSLMEFIDIVIWITMSKDFNLRNVQSQRAKRLNLELDANGAIEERAKMLLKD